MEKHCWRSDRHIPNSNILTHTIAYIILICPSCVLQLGQKLFTATEAILSPGPLNSSDDVTLLLGTVENAIMLIGPQLKESRTKLNTTDTGNWSHVISCDLHTVFKNYEMTTE